MHRPQPAADGIRPRPPRRRRGTGARHGRQRLCRAADEDPYAGPPKPPRTSPGARTGSSCQRDRPYPPCARQGWHRSQRPPARRFRGTHATAFRPGAARRGRGPHQATYAAHVARGRRGATDLAAQRPGDHRFQAWPRPLQDRLPHRRVGGQGAFRRVSRSLCADRRDGAGARRSPCQRVARRTGTHVRRRNLCERAADADFRATRRRRQALAGPALQSRPSGGGTDGRPVAEAAWRDRADRCDALSPARHSSRTPHDRCAVRPGSRCYRIVTAVSAVEPDASVGSLQLSAQRDRGMDARPRPQGAAAGAATGGRFSRPPNGCDAGCDRSHA